MEEVGQKLIKREGKLIVEVEVDWDNDQISVSVSKATNVATILYTLLMGYNSVWMASDEALDSNTSSVVH